ncbi:MAG: hypothetical protein DK306_001983 [Chloroflexi bacterium]|jgi:hypothetical protein|nr:MAG: hypothetical protein DK306_001983 [Chloroflexota bacterium]
MEPNVTPLSDVLGSLTWYAQLSEEHRTDMLAEFSDQIVMNTSRDEFTRRLRAWVDIAHLNAKWSRFQLLQESGLLTVAEEAEGFVVVAYEAA